MGNVPAVSLEKGRKTFVSQAMKFSEADRYCQQSYPDGHLASITDPSENAEVAATCKNLGQLQGACWIGLKNPSNNQPTKWLDDKPFNGYSNWYVGEPDGGNGQPCTVIRQNGLWWTVGYCEQHRLPFVCEEVQYIGDKLTVNQRINVGQGLLSHDKRFAAVMQSDGNFVIYKLDPNSGRIERHLWSTTVNEGVPLSNGYDGRYMIYQSDNHFCMYDENNRYKWCNGAHNGGRNIPTGKVIMQSDSNLCVYNGYNQWMWGSYQDGAVWGNDTTPFNMIDMSAIIIAILILVNILCIIYYFCCSKLRKTNKYSYGKVVSVESDTDV